MSCSSRAMVSAVFLPTSGRVVRALMSLPKMAAAMSWVGWANARRALRPPIPFTPNQRAIERACRCFDKADELRRRRCHWTGINLKDRVQTKGCPNLRWMPPRRRREWPLPHRGGHIPRPPGRVQHRAGSLPRMRSITKLIPPPEPVCPGPIGSHWARPWPLATLRWPASHWLRSTSPEPHPRPRLELWWAQIHDPNQMEAEDSVNKSCPSSCSIHNGHQDSGFAFDVHMAEHREERAESRGRFGDPAFWENPNRPPVRR